MNRGLFDDVAWFSSSMISVLVFFMCAMVDTPFWAYCWLLISPLIWAGKMIHDG